MQPAGTCHVQPLNLLAHEAALQAASGRPSIPTSCMCMPVLHIVFAAHVLEALAMSEPPVCQCRCIHLGWPCRALRPSGGGGRAISSGTISVVVGDKVCVAWVQITAVVQRCWRFRCLHRPRCPLRISELSNCCCLNLILELVCGCSCDTPLYASDVITSCRTQPHDETDALTTAPSDGAGAGLASLPSPDHSQKSQIADQKCVMRRHCCNAKGSNFKHSWPLTVP